jgi:hypothetical protein
MLEVIQRVTSADTGAFVSQFGTVTKQWLVIVLETFPLRQFIECNITISLANPKLRIIMTTSTLIPVGPHGAGRMARSAMNIK